MCTNKTSEGAWRKSGESRLKKTKTCESIKKDGGRWEWDDAVEGKKLGAAGLGGAKIKDSVF